MAAKRTAIKAQLSTMNLLNAYMVPEKGILVNFQKVWCCIIPIIKGH